MDHITLSHQGTFCSGKDKWTHTDQIWDAGSCWNPLLKNLIIISSSKSTCPYYEIGWVAIQRRSWQIMFFVFTLLFKQANEKIIKPWLELSCSASHSLLKQSEEILSRGEMLIVNLDHLSNLRFPCLIICLLFSCYGNYHSGPCVLQNIIFWLL